MTEVRGEQKKIREESGSRKGREAVGDEVYRVKPPQKASEGMGGIHSMSYNA